MSREDLESSSQYQSIQKGLAMQGRTDDLYPKLHLNSLVSLNYSDTNLETSFSNVNSNVLTDSKSKGFMLPFGKKRSLKNPLIMQSSTLPVAKTDNQTSKKYFR